MFEPITIDDGREEQDVSTSYRHDDDEGRPEIEVLGVAAVVLAAIVFFACWQFFRGLLDYLDWQWSWEALEFDMPLDIPGFMDLALIGLIVCMLAAGQPYFARLMRRPWNGWSDTSLGLYWLGSAVCAWCLMSASNLGLPLEIISHLGISIDDWGVAAQLSYIVLSVVVYVLIASFTKNNPGPLAALGLCLSPLVAAASGIILLATGIAYLTTIALKKIGAALNAEDEEEDEWTDEDDELLGDLIFKWHRTRKEDACEQERPSTGDDESMHPTSNPFEADSRHKTVADRQDEAQPDGADCDLSQNEASHTTPAPLTDANADEAPERNSGLQADSPDAEQSDDRSTRS